MNEDNATRAELLEALAAQAVRLARMETDRDVWRNESIKKQAACEQMGNRICALEIERDRLRNALSDAVADLSEHFEAYGRQAIESAYRKLRAALKENNQ